MVGNWRLKGLICVIIPFSFFFFMSQNTYAQQINSFTTVQSVCRGSTNGAWVTITNNNSNQIYGNSTGYNSCYRTNASLKLTTNLSGRSFTGSATLNIAISSNSAHDGGFFCNNLRNGSYDIKPEQGTVSNINNQLDECVKTYSSSNYSKYRIKISSNGNLSANTTVSSFFLRLIGTQQAPILETVSIPNDTIVNFIDGDINFTMTTDQNTAVMGEINQNITNINNTINDHYEKEQEALDNISNQTPSDIQNAENQATTNLIGVLSSFLSQLTSFSATNCNLTLPFPNFIGGSKTVNICQGKDILGNFITIVGTLAMVAFYIPLAIVLLKMIYNEIRSFTNG